MAKSLTKQQIEEFQEAFTLFDKDKDGLITLLELEESMRSLGLKPNLKELNEMINEIDVDGNGTVDFPEFLTVMARKMEEEEGEDELKASFNLFDEVGDGYISKDELGRSMENLGQRMAPETLIKMFREADSDGDGFINFEEFSAIMTSN